LVKLSGVGISQIRRYETDKSTPSLDATIRLVKALGVSIDEMVFDKTTAIASNKIIDRELLEQFEMISYMDEEERSLVKKILEGVIVKNQVEKLLKPKPEKPWSQRFREITDRLAQGAKDYSQDDIDKVIDEAVALVRKKSYARS
jgi:transcriptional regulator with XRE-family HTH domain